MDFEKSRNGWVWILKKVGTVGFGFLKKGGTV